MKKSIIGIVAGSDISTAKLSKKYLHSVVDAGGYPIILGYQGDILDSIDIVDGLIFSGGGDFGRLALGEDVHPSACDIDEERDYNEVKLVRKAIEIGMPMLGICRGMQVINLACGGSIIQDVAGHVQNRPRDIASHEVIINKDSKLYGVYGSDSIEVNSFHHQVVNKVGTDIEVCAYSKDGYAEAIEGHDFILGVQWHPECLRDKNSCKLFKWLISRTIDFNARRNYN